MDEVSPDRDGADERDADRADDPADVDVDAVSGAEDTADAGVSKSDRSADDRGDTARPGAAADPVGSADRRDLADHEPGDAAPRPAEDPQRPATGTGGRTWGAAEDEPVPSTVAELVALRARQAARAAAQEPENG